MMSILCNTILTSRCSSPTASWRRRTPLQPRMTLTWTTPSFTMAALAKASVAMMKSMCITATTSGCLLCLCCRLPFAISHGKKLFRKIAVVLCFNPSCRYFWKKSEGGMIGQLLTGLSSDPLTETPVDDQVCNFSSIDWFC